MDWSRFRLLTEDMNWGDKCLIRPELLSELDAFLVFLGLKFFVSCGTDGKHAEHSLHYSGRAVDVLFVSPYPGHLLDAFTAALRFQFTEVGAYPKWQFNGRTVGGLHLGRADHPSNEIPRRKLWLGVPGPTGQIYLGATAKNFAAYGMMEGIK